MAARGLVVLASQYAAENGGGHGGQCVAYLLRLVQPSSGEELLDGGAGNRGVPENT